MRDAADRLLQDLKWRLSPAGRRYRPSAQVIRSWGASEVPQLVPFLLIVATGLYALGGWLVRFLPRTDGPPRAMPLVESIAAVYGGYFGSGLGVMLLALLRLQGIENDHEANGLKNFLSALNGTTSAAIFIASGLVSWPETLAVFTGALLGGFGLGSMVRHVPRTFLRALVIASGLTLSVVYFWRVYGPA